MKRFAAVAVAVAVLIGAAGLFARAVACEEEGPGFASVRIAVTLSDADLANVVGEALNGTYTLKGIVMHGTATWREDEVEILTGPVQIDAVLLGTGDATTYLQNRAILSLTYTFFDAAGTTPIGTGTGFVTLEEAAERSGRSAFQGTVTLEGTARQFAGTGGSYVRVIPPPPPPVPPVTALDCGEQQLGIFQEMEEVVITGAKPGFAFESAETVKQLDRQYREKTKRLTQERNQRLRVIRSGR